MRHASAFRFSVNMSDPKGFDNCDRANWSTFWNPISSIATHNFLSTMAMTVDNFFRRHSFEDIKKTPRKLLRNSERCLSLSIAFQLSFSFSKIFNVAFFVVFFCQNYRSFFILASSLKNFSILLWQFFLSTVLVLASAKILVLLLR